MTLEFDDLGGMDGGGEPRTGGDASLPLADLGSLERRTFAIISHPDAGKTTLTEKLLLSAGAIREAGEVHARGDRRRARGIDRGGARRLLKRLIESNRAKMAEDQDDAPVLMMRNEWEFSRFVEEWPEVEFLAVRERM